MACTEEEGRDVLALLGDEASDVDFLGIFRGGSEAYEAFQKIDMQQFRVEWLLRPPSSSDISPEPGEVAEGEYCSTYLNDDGLECGRRFVSHRALLVHQRRATGGQHGIPSAISKLVLTNQCVACLSTFRCRDTAVRHLVNAYRFGRCRVNSSQFNPPVQDPED
eukprot:353404-Pyramimonas_sp.AAC.1